MTNEEPIYKDLTNLCKENREQQPVVFTGFSREIAAKIIEELKKGQKNELFNERCG